MPGVSVRNLSLAEVCGMLDQLIAGYADPAFQHKLMLIYKEYGGGDELESKDLIIKRREHLLPVQAPVLEKYGFEGTQAGVHKSYLACQRGHVQESREFHVRNEWINLLIHRSPRDLALEATRREEERAQRWRALTLKVVSSLSLKAGKGCVLSPPGGGMSHNVIRFQPLDDDTEWQNVLSTVESDGEALAFADDRYRRDPDVVLAAVRNCPGAFRHASTELRLDGEFCREVVQQNWKALEFLPETFRANLWIIYFAAREDRAAAGLASLSTPAADVAHVANAAAKAGSSSSSSSSTPPPYEAEALRLVGYCNQWRLTDAKLRFQRGNPPGGESDGGDRSHLPGTRWRHWLMVHLEQGCLSFQVISCTRGFGFRVYPSEAGQDGFFRLVRGDPPLVTSNIGGYHDGHGHNFYINEKPGAVVCIHVLVDDCSSKRRGASVWYDLERDLCGPQQLVSLSQARDKQEPKFKLDGTSCYDLKVLEDVEGNEDHYDLVKEAFQLSETYFTTQFDIKVVTGGRHLSLLVDAAGVNAFGYCIYSVVREQSFFWVESLFILPACRRKGMGRVLLRWAASRAELAGCVAVRLRSASSAEPFYRAVGYVAVPDATDGSMELLLPRKD